MAWLTVVVGTWVVYPGYRAEPPAGTHNLNAYPKATLVADPDTTFWHEFGMEWKEHVGWLAPFLATVVAFVALRYPRLVSRDARVRRALGVIFVLTFVIAVVAGAAGAFINKVAPNQFLDH